MKIAVIILSLLNGAYMLLDGIYVLINGKYIGPAKPGPWANLFSYFNIDVFKLGPLFIVYGLAWLYFVFTFSTNTNSSFVFGIVLSILTLWYLPVGTVFSLVILVLIILLMSK